ncbi:hypothetical protein [Chitinophaga cymbidii]|uniref:Uncharacterized protein n=1 Tax=Chitinophaga cymbidii TaxID=1096750 RepID=A0A512RIR0_9BACT|nr:hypothetical protein [Chitinophaga cymbidii]GEP95560.1 hypothetical protein CCY01nite_18200 [Chitinophaga cymbidii]
MATEAQLQKQLLESGFLNTLGANDDKLVLNEVEKIFVKWMGRLVEVMQERLNTARADGTEITASGRLSESIRFEYEVSGTGYEGTIFMAHYADYVDKGVQGVGPNNQNSTSPYSFKFAFPTKKHQEALIMWVRQKNVLTDVTAPKGLLGKHTRAFLRNDARRKSLAISIGVASKRKGLKARPFKAEAIDEVLAAMTKEIAQATARDVKINVETSVLK